MNKPIRTLQNKALELQEKLQYNNQTELQDELFDIVKKIYIQDPNFIISNDIDQTLNDNDMQFLMENLIEQDLNDQRILKVVNYYHDYLQNTNKWPTNWIKSNKKYILEDYPDLKTDWL